MCVIEDRQVTGQHLMWAQTHSTVEEEARLMSRLEDLAKRFSVPPQATSSGGSSGEERSEPPGNKE